MDQGKIYPNIQMSQKVRQSRKNPSKIGFGTQRKEGKQRQELGMERYDARIAGTFGQKYEGLVLSPRATESGFIKGGL